MQRKHWLICTSKYDKIAALLASQKLQGNACEISSILQCKGILSGQALIGPIILQKKDLSRHLLLPGHQVHPGGPRPPGLRTGINTNGKTVRGLKSGEMRQHRLRSQEVDPSTRKLVEHDFEQQVGSFRHQHMTAVVTFFVTDFNN